MTSAAYIIIPLLVLLVILAGISVVLLLKSTKNPVVDGESAEVLRERLQAREQGIQRLQDAHSQQLASLQSGAEEIATLREKISHLETRIAEEQSQHEEKIGLLENAREKMSLEFRNLANEILEQKGKVFTESNRENI